MDIERLEALVRARDIIRECHERMCRYDEDEVERPESISMSYAKRYLLRQIAEVTGVDPIDVGIADIQESLFLLSRDPAYLAKEQYRRVYGCLRRNGVAA